MPMFFLETENVVKQYANHLALDKVCIQVPEGKVFGLIYDRIIGSHGFGYDPIFYYPEFNKTFAECTMEEKNKVSHRFRALTEIKKLI